MLKLKPRQRCFSRTNKCMMLEDGNIYIFKKKQKKDHLQSSPPKRGLHIRYSDLGDYVNIIEGCAHICPKSKTDYSQTIGAYGFTVCHIA